MEYHLNKDDIGDNFDWSNIEPKSTIFLVGNFDELVINNLRHNPIADHVRITAEANTVVEIKNLVLRNCANLIFDGSNNDGKNRIIIHSKIKHLSDQKWRYNLVKIKDCVNTQIQCCTIYSDGIEKRRKNQKKWRKYAQDGIIVKRGSGCILTSNLIRDVYTGITLMSRASNAVSNSIYGYCGDGIRLLDSETIATGNNIAYSYNDCVPLVDCGGSDKRGSHNDAIQIWNYTADTPNTGKVSGLSVTDNIIYCPEVNNMNIDLDSQGICCFNGKIRNSEFLRNKVLTNHSHGITLINPKNCTVSDNIIVPADENEISEIKLNRSKKGSSNNVDNNKVYGASLYIDGIPQSDSNYITIDGKQENNTNTYMNRVEMEQERQKIHQLFET